jgi:hypothetical protein
MYLYQQLERDQPTVRKRSIEISDDVPCWKSRRFRHLCGKYLSLTSDDVAPKNHPDEETRKKEWAKAKLATKRLLEDIANAA